MPLGWFAHICTWEGDAPGNLETGLLPVFSFTLDSINRLHLQELLICLRPNILQSGNAAGWERVGTQDSLGHILCSGAHLSLLISLGQWWQNLCKNLPSLLNSCPAMYTQNLHHNPGPWERKIWWIWIHWGKRYRQSPNLPQGKGGTHTYYLLRW